ncbi:MAG: F0F1 ATP synthase subunit A [Verrucomicrobiota bacterium]|nr:F0F1 ATP synthase subunit A [Verrucomicrobiota bacterium]
MNAIIMIKFAPDTSSLFDPSSFFLLGEVPINAEPFVGDSGLLSWLSNSIFVAAIVVLLILWASRKATKNIQRIPTGFQNFFEFTIEFLFNQVEQIVGKKLAPRVFPLLATIFIYILIANWFGLLPGVGTIGFGFSSPFGPGSSDHIVPLLRPATADLNLTLGMAALFMVIWVWLTVKEIGVWGFIKHTFGPKGGLKGKMLMVIVPIFLFVGVIEIISIGLRPVSLSLRLFGNIFAGENLLHVMGRLGEILGAGPILAWITSWIIPLPTYFLELLVGGLQAMVFALLCAVYIQLSTTHDEEEEH